MSSQWYEEVWSWTVSAYACRPSLARCSGASKVQTRDNGVQLSPRQGSFVPDRLLHSYIRRCVTASSAFCQSSSTTRPSTQSLHIWSSGFFSRGSGCLELPVWRTAWTAVNCEQFQTYLKLVCLLSTAYSALEVLHIMRYKNLLTYLLTYSRLHISSHLPCLPCSYMIIFPRFCIQAVVVL